MIHNTSAMCAIMLPDLLKISGKMHKFYYLHEKIYKPFECNAN